MISGQKLITKQLKHDIEQLSEQLKKIKQDIKYTRQLEYDVES